MTAPSAPDDPHRPAAPADLRRPHGHAPPLPADPLAPHDPRLHPHDDPQLAVTPEDLRRRVAPPQPALRRTVRYLFPRSAQRDVSPLREAWLVLIYTARRWLQIDHSMTLASSLALQTLLSIVPFAGLVLTLVGLLGHDSGRGFLNTLISMVIPDSARVAGITGTLYDLARNVTLEHLGIVGFFGSLVGASLLFLTLEATLNDIWRVKYRRGAVAKFTMFYTLTTLAPLVVWFSLASPIVTTITDQRFTVLPLLSTLIAFVLLNRLMPATSVRWRCAAIGGLAGAVLFELGKRGFTVYLGTITTYEGTYGALAILPVFCVWAYVSWLIVLFSVELTFVVQHLPLVRREGYVPPKAREDADIGVGAARLACRVVLAVCDHYDRHGTGLSARTLVARFQVDSARLSSILTALEHAGILLAVAEPESAFVPGRPLDHIRVLEIMRMFASRDVEAPRADTLSDQFARLDATIAEIFAHTTFHDLIREARVSRSAATGDPIEPELAAAPVLPPRSH
ncbi:MAG: YihY/virulence factor BrkB family protein [Myxococcales bacterium]|nr:YihY/virulence factor BrkB family protein [Myxococcales bacterium]